MMMINIGKTYIEYSDDEARLCSKVRIGNRERVFWFAVKKDHEDCLSKGRSDAFVFILLPAAMRQKLDIHSEDPMSERLHHQLSYDLIPALAKAGDLYHMIHLETPVTSEPFPSAHAVATGFSGGVDSLYTVFRHYRKTEYPLTHLAVFNSGVYEGQNYRLGFNKACQTCRQFAEENGFETIFVDSNVYELLPENYIEIASFRLLGFALAIQGLVSVYLLSSGFSMEDYQLDPSHAACFDPLTISCVNTESLQFYLSGIDCRRVDKLEALSEWEPSYHWLSPCVFGKPGKMNCGRCKKCMWDLATLYALDKLEAYRPVFDVDDYKKNLSQRLGFVLAYKKDPFCRDVVRLMQEKKTKISPLAFKCAEMFEKAMNSDKDGDKTR